MKKCTKCGKTYEDSEFFCEECGGELVAVPKQSEKKSPLPVIIGCGAAVVLLIVVTVVGVGLIKGKSSKTEQESMTVVQNEQEENQDSSVQEEVESFEMVDEDAVTEEVQATETPEPTQQATPEPTQQATPEPTPEETKEEMIYQTCFVVNCKESITLRSAPSTKASEICQIPLGAPVSYVETAENGFYKIIYNGKTGYGLASYLNFDDGEENAIFMQVVNCKESITLRKVPSTSADEFCQIPLGAVVQFLGSAENGFYYVEYNGYDGYALSSYLTEW